MQQHGIEFHPRGKDQKAHLAEAHLRLVRENMHCLDEEARQGGVELPLRELVVHAVGARNNLSEFGGFSPTQALSGHFPSNWSRAEPLTSEERMEDTLWKRMVAQRAIHQAIFESRISVAARGKGSEVNREDIEIGNQIEVYVKPNKKDVIGWRRNCTVISIDSEGKVDYRWQGRIFKAPAHLTRPPP